MHYHRRMAARSLGSSVASWAAGSAGTTGRPVGSEQGRALAGRDTQLIPSRVAPARAADGPLADGPFGYCSQALPWSLIVSAVSDNKIVT